MNDRDNIEDRDEQVEYPLGYVRLGGSLAHSCPVEIQSGSQVSTSIAGKQQSPEIPSGCYPILYSVPVVWIKIGQRRLCASDT